jgi:UDP-GlcNAc:undecaprenyl-phosphate GlcNAc-1-phosphate transferase
VSVTLAGSAVSVLVALVVGWFIPWLVVRALLPALAHAPWRVENYRGTSLAPALGVVWAVWAAGILAAGSALAAITALAVPASLRSGADLLTDSPVFATLDAMPIVLVLGALAFGMIDDAFGGADAKGFAGHLGALAHGRLTTGALKAVGIGLLAIGAGWSALGVSVGADVAWASTATPAARLALWPIAAAVIALGANLANLLDLRPGRTLKAYLVVAAPASFLLAWRLGAAYGLGPTGIAGGWSATQTWAAALSLFVLAVGPALAVWPFDLGERGMLGDAGANAAGALGGYLIVAASPPVVLIAAFGVLLFLNLAAERVSFSEVIRYNKALRWLDGLGRPRSGQLTWHVEPTHKRGRFWRSGR